jgi:hypothetical protein
VPLQPGTIEWTMPLCDRTVDAIEQEKSNSKICVHAPVVVYSVVMTALGIDAGG